MSLTVKDFVQMVKDGIKAQGLRRYDRVMPRLRAKYGSFFNPKADVLPRQLTPEGVDEYNAVKAWIATRCKRALKPAHSCDLVSRKRTARRKVALYVRHMSNTTGRKASYVRRLSTGAAKPVRQVIAREPVRHFYEEPKVQFQRLKSSNAALLMRSALLKIGESPATTAITKKYIADVLDVCDEELRALVNG